MSLLLFRISWRAGTVKIIIVTQQIFLTGNSPYYYKFIFAEYGETFICKIIFCNHRH